MSDKQNPNPGKDESLPAGAEESTREKSEPPISYYYDDATGYEIYKEEERTGEDDTDD